MKEQLSIFSALMAPPPHRLFVTPIGSYVAVVLLTLYYRSEIVEIVNDDVQNAIKTDDCLQLS